MFSMLIHLLMPVSACWAAVFAQPQASDAGFSAYIREYQHPEFFSDNESAFRARLKLLDMAPAGAHASIATFVFENGKSVRQLARHICLASQRGVHVRLLIDSKSGGRPGFDDLFDKSAQVQVQEDLLQYMANCGAQVWIHNQLSAYVEVFGFRLPNIFGDSSLNHKKLGLFHLPKLLKRFHFLLERAADLTENELEKAGIPADPRPLFRSLRKLGFAFVGALMGDGGNSSGLRRNYEDILLNPLWDHVPAARLRNTTSRIEERFHRDPVFGPVIKEVRRYNRLNHRKLFFVENKGEACMILGGRNLGPHYLENEEGSYFDGDMLLCSHHSGGAEAALASAGVSFDDLIRDTSDPFLRRSGEGPENHVLQLKPNYGHVYRNLAFPESLRPWRAQVARHKGKIPEADRSLVREVRWANSKALHGGFELRDGFGWRILFSGWSKEQDEVRAELLKLISEEREEIFLETPYAEFDYELRHALEAALQRGVRVRMITNSYFTSDGPSGLIRVLMSHWNEKMKVRFGARFDLHFTVLSGRRKAKMTHFKFAAFGCQPGGRRVQMLGSHNFHPRSGYADKEHMLLWEESGGCGMQLYYSSLVAERHRFYNDLAKSVRHRILARHRDFLSELQAVIALEKFGRTKDIGLAESLRSMLYEKDDSGTWKLRLHSRSGKVLEYLDESGLHDLMGRVL